VLSSRVSLTDEMVGWDPIFEYEGQTYAEMDMAAKVFRPLFPSDFLSGLPASQTELY
jgi:hypothetical protein